MCEKSRFGVDYFIYPFFDTSTGHIFRAILTLSGSIDVILQPLVPLVPFENFDDNVLIWDDKAILNKIASDVCLICVQDVITLVWTSE